MKNKIISLALIAGLAACSGGNPFDETDTDGGTTGGTNGGTTGGTNGGTTGGTDGGTTDGTDTSGETDGDGIAVDGIPPGTESPNAGSTIYRSEARVDSSSASGYGSGFANSVSYNSTDDTFTVNNLAFDGDSPYVRGEDVSSFHEGEDLGRFSVYEAEELANDPISGDAINQFTYRAIYGTSRNRTGENNELASTQFAIIRTGNYVRYGFGGFVYQRDDSVILPETLQAKYTGRSAGLRDFNTDGGLQYTTADVEIIIDSEDFDEGAGVDGTIRNRRVYDLAGNDITSTVANGISPNLTEIPVAQFVIGPGVLEDSGDLVGEITSQYRNAEGEIIAYEEGNYYAIVSGDDADEIVGIFVLEALDTRDTGGFIVYRGDPVTQ
ncbi:hypothetical protein [Sulfitobacter sp.]|uniref:hypothetical protein n=1 Tax=Sulfitobacter sp. TaxID=1903071 RepID=UPI0030039BB4